MTFEKLKFKPNRYTHGSQAKYSFPNGYGISVIDGYGTYSMKGTYEVGITYEDHLTYNTPLTNDVLADQTPEEINEILATIEKWSPNQY